MEFAIPDIYVEHAECRVALGKTTRHRLSHGLRVLIL